MISDRKDSAETISSDDGYQSKKSEKPSKLPDINTSSNLVKQDLGLSKKEDKSPSSLKSGDETNPTSANKKHKPDDKSKELNIKWDELLLRLATLSSLILLFCVSNFFTLELLLFSLIVIDIFLFYEYQTLEYSLLLLPMECIDNVNKIGGHSALAMSTIFAGCWAISQTVLSWQFLLELFEYISSFAGFALPLLYWKVAFIALATCIITFMLGQKVMGYDICEEIFNPTNIGDNSGITDSEKYYIQICKLVLLALTYYSIVGYSLEWTLALTAFAPYSLAFIVVAVASLTISRFVVKRVNRTVDEIAKLIKNTSYKDMAIKFISYAAICFLVFSILKIVPFSWISIEISADIICLFGFIEYFANDNLLDDLANRVSLIAHAAGESLIPTAGMSVILPWYMLPVFALMLTIFEVMTDSCHEDEENYEENEYSIKVHVNNLNAKEEVYDYPNLKKMGINHNNLFCFFSDISLLERLGYEPEDYTSSVPGVGWSNNSRNVNNNPAFSNKKDISSIILPHKDKITIHEAVNLVCLSKKTATAGDLVNCGFSYKEIIDSNVVPYEQLKKHRINDYKYISLQLADVIFLTIFSVIFINYNVFVLTLGLSIITYYAVLLLNMEDECGLKYTTITGNMVYRTCAVTCFSLGITGGLECLKVFGASIYVAIALALFGVLVESSVFFDELMKSEHTHDSIADYIPKFDSVVVCSLILGALSFSLYNIAIVYNITLITSLQVAIIVFPLIVRNLYDDCLRSYIYFKENGLERKITINSFANPKIKSVELNSVCNCCPRKVSIKDKKTQSQTEDAAQIFKSRSPTVKFMRLVANTWDSFFGPSEDQDDNTSTVPTAS